MGTHIALLGDSILDNQAYTEGAPDVLGHLRGILPSPWRATLCAVDGSKVADLAAQLPNVPTDCSHLVVSIGGNDALGNGDLLMTSVRSTQDALALFSDRIGEFERAYRAAIDEVLALRLDTTLCTIYNGDLEPNEAPLARVALMMFNDVILRVAFAHRLRAIELRQVCTAPADYFNQIEPSGEGGSKIAGAIAKALGVGGEPGVPARVYTT